MAMMPHEAWIYLADQARSGEDISWETEYCPYCGQRLSYGEDA